MWSSAMLASFAPSNQPVRASVAEVPIARASPASGPAGTVVTTGTWCGVLHATAGDRVVVAFDGIGRAEVRF